LIDNGVQFTGFGLWVQHKFSSYLILVMLWWKQGRSQGTNFFSSPFFNNIYNFSLSNKVIKILAPLNFIFYFRHWMEAFELGIVPWSIYFDGLRPNIETDGPIDRSAWLEVTDLPIIY
jgi:hypothetical protein